MGRESAAVLWFSGTHGPGKIMLESTEVILRGAVRLRLPRTAITGYRAEADDLVIHTAEGPVRATLAPGQAALWVRALAKPAPGLAEKLGVNSTAPVQVLGLLTDASLIAALGDCTVAQAPRLIAELTNHTALALAEAALANPDCSVFWAVTVKGKTSNLAEAAVRARLRSLGWIDTKSCSVSQTHAATRFQRR